jgi:hypothetical protein
MGSTFEDLSSTAASVPDAYFSLANGADPEHIFEQLVDKILADDGPDDLGPPRKRQRIDNHGAVAVSDTNDLIIWSTRVRLVCLIVLYIRIITDSGIRMP